MENNETLHREGNRFQIKNGNWLKGYPLSSKDAPVLDNAFDLDRTGVYLVVGRGRKKKRRAVKIPPKVIDRLFWENAYFFWEHRDIIYSDSRLFLAPVPVQNGLAYYGTHGFQRPTLGVYLEWWESCEQAHLTDEQGNERLIWYISGSPLSGANACASVDKDGNSKTTPSYSFFYVWRSFVRVNTLYDEVKKAYKAYTLEQVIQKLQTLERRRARLRFLQQVLAKVKNLFGMS